MERNWTHVHARTDMLKPECLRSIFEVGVIKTHLPAVDGVSFGKREEI